MLPGHPAGLAEPFCIGDGCPGAQRPSWGHTDPPGVHRMGVSGHTDSPGAQRPTWDTQTLLYRAQVSQGTQTLLPPSPSPAGQDPPVLLGTRTCHAWIGLCSCHIPTPEFCSSETLWAFYLFQSYRSQTKAVRPALAQVWVCRLPCPRWGCFSRPQGVFLVRGPGLGLQPGCLFVQSHCEHILLLCWNAL